MAKLIKVERNLYKDEVSGFLVWRESVDGEHFWKSTGEKTLGAARAKIKKYRMDVLGKEDPKRRRKEFRSIFKTLLEVQSSKAPSTLQMAKTQINGHLLPWFQANCPYLNIFEKQYIKLWSQYVSDQRNKTPGRKLEHDRRHLLMALRLAKSMQWVRRDFTKKDFPLKEFSSPIGRAISKQEWERLECAAKEVSPVLHLQVLLAYYMGMRLREILHLQRDEVDLERGEIKIAPERIKTRQPRVIPVPIHENVAAPISEALAACKGKFVFPSRLRNCVGAPFDYSRPQDDNAKPWRRALKIANVKCRFHDLRHTAITNMLAAGIPPLSVSQVTGAGLRVINRIYNHITDSVVDQIRRY